MSVGIHTSTDVIGHRSRGRFGPARPVSRTSRHDDTLARRCWAASTLSARVVVVVCAALAIAVTADPAIPFGSGAAIAVLTPAAMIDLHTRRLPDVWVGAAAAVFVLSIGVGWVAGQGNADTAGIVIGALVMSMPLLLLHLSSPTSMGFGDVKTAIVLGAALGAVEWQLTLGALALAAGATASVGLVRNLRYIAFGPGLLGGSLIALLARDLLIRS